MSEEAGESRVASSFIWAVALIVIVGIVMAALFYGGFLGNKKKTQVDVNISVPSR
jgi:hypothetical protein